MIDLFIDGVFICSTQSEILYDFAARTIEVLCGMEDVVFSDSFEPARTVNPTDPDGGPACFPNC